MKGPSEHLSWLELACHNAVKTPYPEEWRATRAIILAHEFEAIRAMVGRPLVVLSGYRTPDWNRHVGGVPQSQHVQGRALDLRCPGKTVEWLENRVRLRIAVPAGSLIRGLGMYPTFVHVDVRPSVRLAVWNGARPRADALA